MGKCSENEHIGKSRQLKADFSSKSLLHSQCRQTEKTKLDEKKGCEADIKTFTESKESTCGALETLEKSIYSYSSSISVKTGETFKEYHARLIQASQDKLAEWENSNKKCTDAKENLATKTSACSNAPGAYTSQKEHCDSLQDAMDGFSCSYLQSETTKCETMDSCFKRTTATHETVVSTSELELESLRTEWRGFLRMECLVRSFSSAEAERAAAIDQCQSMDTTAQASIDLKLTPPTLATMPSCAAPTDTAGSMAYRTAQYQSLPAEAPAKECVASCCAGVSCSSETVISNNDPANDNRLEQSDAGGYVVTLNNGDRVWTRTTSGRANRAAGQAFDSGTIVTEFSGWDHAWHGACGSGQQFRATPEQLRYTFNNRVEKVVTSVKLWQSPTTSHKHFIGKVDVKYFDGTEWTSVANQTPAGFTGTAVFADGMTINFDAVKTSELRLDLYPHADTPDHGRCDCPGASEIQLMGCEATS